MFRGGAEERKLPWPGRYYQPYLPEPSDDLTQRALALYREGLSTNAVAYQSLSFFKVLNLFKSGNKEQAGWIDENWEKAVRADVRKAFEKNWQGATKDHPTIGRYLIYRNRSAIAHAFDGNQSFNPDDWSQVKRLGSEVEVVRSLAYFAIRSVIGLKSSVDVWDEHLYELDGFKPIFGDAFLSKILQEQPLAQADIPKIPPLSLTLVHHENFPALDRMETRQVEQQGTTLVLHLVSEDEIVEMLVVLDFGQERLEIDPEFALRVSADDTIAATEMRISSLKFRDAYLGNGILQIFNADSGELLGRKDAYLPTNIDMQRSHENFERAVARNEARLAELRRNVEALAQIETDDTLATSAQWSIKDV